MNETLKPIIHELSSRIVEWSPKQRVKINLFEEELEPGIRINTFGSINQYRLHLAKIYEGVKIDIELEIMQSKEHALVMGLLENYLILIKENQINHLPENFDFILFSVEFKTHPHYKDMANDAIKKTSIFCRSTKRVAFQA
jgi:hypothetical protein